MGDKRYRLVRTAAALADLSAIRDYTLQNFGEAGWRSYTALLRQSFTDIRNYPYRPGSKERPEIGEGVRSYHISHSRTRAQAGVKAARHFLLYYLPQEADIVISRVLHEARDLARHIPEDDIERAKAFRPTRDG